RLRARLPALLGAGQLPRHRRPGLGFGGEEADRGAPLDPSDRARPRRRPLEPLPGRRLSDLRLCLSGRDPGGDLDRTTRRRCLRRQGAAPDHVIETACTDAPLMDGLPDEWEAAPEPGWVAPALADEFPGLQLATTALEISTGRSPEALKQRLRDLSDRIGGAQ